MKNTVENIAADRQLFVDDYLIQSMTGTALRQHEPRNEGVFLALDRPWEGVHSGHASVVKAGDTYRVYYRGMPTAGDGSTAECTCMAVSADGISAERPDIGLFEVSGTKNNNVVISQWAPFSHNFMPFVDTRPGVPADARFKAVAGLHKTGLHFFASADGVDWRKISDEPGITSEPFAFDSPNVAFWSEHENRYLCYYRTWKDKVRWVSRAASDDLLTWSEPEEMEFVHDGAAAPAEHIYTTAIQPYFRAPDVYIAMPRRFMPKKQVLSEKEADSIGVSPTQRDSCSDTILVSSRGGTRFDRTFLEALIRPGPERPNWSSRSGTVGVGLVQTGPREMSMYRTEHYGSPSVHIQRYSLRLDGFVSIHGPYGSGEAVTRPLVFSGSKLTLNYETSAAGCLQVEIQDEHGKPIPKYSLDKVDGLVGDEIEQPVSWNGDSDLSELAGTPVRLRFVLADADLYSFVFAPESTG